jgi:hypothetical protein
MCLRIPSLPQQRQQRQHGGGGWWGRAQVWLRALPLQRVELCFDLSHHLIQLLKLIFQLLYFVLPVLRLCSNWLDAEGEEGKHQQLGGSGISPDDLRVQTHKGSSVPEPATKISELEGSFLSESLSWANGKDNKGNP